MLANPRTNIDEFGDKPLMVVTKHQIDEEIASNKIMMFAKSSDPMCDKAKDLLR